MKWGGVSLKEILKMSARFRMGLDKAYKYEIKAII